MLALRAVCGALLLKWLETLEARANVLGVGELAE